MLKSFRLLIFIIILFTYQSINSQNNQFTVEHYSINNGLSQNFANCIYQDKFGYIWIGTQDGLNRFDGYEFVSYRQDSNDEFSISNNYVTDIVGSKDSTLWLITNDGLEKFDYRTNHFTTVIKNKQHSKSIYSTKVKCVCEDKNGQLWLRTIEGIISYNPKKEQFLEYKQTNENNGFVSLYNRFSISQDLNNDLWTGSINGLVKFDKQTKKFITYKIGTDPKKNEVFYVYIESKNKIFVGAKEGVYIFNPNTEKLKKIPSNGKTTNVRVIYKDKNDILWVGTEFGLMYLKPGTEKLDFFRLENYVAGEVNIGNVLDILEDNSGLLWICSDYGIFKIDSKKKYFNLYRKDKSNSINFSSNTIYSIFYDNETKLIWLGTRGFGLNIFNRKTNHVTHYNTSNSNLTNNDIHCIVPDNKGNIWLGTSNGPFIYNKARKSFISFSKSVKQDFSEYFLNNRTSDIFFDKGNIWFSTLNGLYKYTSGKMIPLKKDGTVNSIISDDIFKLIRRKNGEIWIATDYGLSKYDEKNNSFVNYSKSNKKISGNSAHTVFESSNQTLWVGTSSGLNKYNEKDDTFTFYTSQSHGFSNDFIYTVSEDKSKNLWLSTNKGIIRFNPLTEKVVNYTSDDNLQGYEYNIGSVYSADSINEIFWGGISGLNSINLNTIKKNLYTPKPIITKFIKSSNRGKTEILLGKTNEIFLTHKESSFEIHFAIPEYTHPLKNKFKYKFKGSKEWVDLGYKNSITFFQLSPGDYTFMVIGANSDDSWNLNPVTLKIHIFAPWWLTKIAISLYILGGILILLTGFFLYNRGMRQENKTLLIKEIAAKEVQKQKNLLSVRNNSIAESMRYASRIIEAMLPTKKYIKSLIPDSFILFMSKEIVSGDFYWVDESVDKIFVAAVDCTGHGVPGAFMSIIGLDILRNTLAKGINTPGEILDELNLSVANIFKKKDGYDNGLKDGMDVSIIAIHKYKNIVEYAGAINQLFLIRNGSIKEYKANRFSISPINTGYGSYKNNVINVEDDDMIYLFSDGYVDQFGGPEEKKFKYRRFRHLLLNNYHKPVEEQKDMLERVINTWRGQLEQIDDILVMGIRIHTKN